MNLSQLRSQYQKARLNKADLLKEPILQCKKWLNEAILAELPHPNAMSLATVDETGQPSSRIVLLKDLTEQGLSFYTNSLSHKGRDIANNPKVCLHFYWNELERQIRVEGIASQLSKEAADAYFASRPRMSQLSAWASEQSQVIKDRATLEAMQQSYAEKFKDQVPRPPHWLGYQVRPLRWEFWQGRPDRLHDSFCYVQVDLGWKILRLAP